MTIEELGILFAEHPEIGLIRRELKKGGANHLLITGLHASARALVLHALEKERLFVVLDNEDEARYLYSDLQSLEAEVRWTRRRRSCAQSVLAHCRTRKPPMSL